jgi:hypothetical protein
MSILPTASVGPGVLGPSYDFSESVPLPGNINVRRGDSLESVINAVKGAAFYTDVIGFGEASSDLTRSMGTKPRPLGLNYFVRTGLQCSNGADMWYYVNGIPTGNSLGKAVKDGLASTGLPSMRGLAPGILEDAQDALNPAPIMNAVLGSGYPKCKKVTMPVGDSEGKIRGADGTLWITGPIQNGTQTRWVQDTDARGNLVYLSKADFDKDAKIFKADGTPKREGFKGGSFRGYGGSGARYSPEEILVGGLVLLAIVVVSYTAKRR